MHEFRGRSRPAIAVLAAIGLVLTALVTVEAEPTTPAQAADGYARPAGAAEVPILPCDLYAAANGDDGNPGTRTQPLKNIRALTQKLQPGQTGCLKNGDTIALDSGGWGIMFGGTPGNAKIVRPETPGQRATVTGPNGFLVGDTEHDLMFKDIDFRRTGVGPLFVVNGDRIVFDGIDLTNPKNICLTVGGDARAGEFEKTAEDFVLIDSRIHGCGTEHLNDPHDVGGAHGVYLALTRDGDGDGKSAIIYNTLFDHNKDRGLQLYPDADDVWASRVVIAHNGANLNIGSELPNARSEGARISHAIIADSRLDFDDPIDPNPSNANDIVGNFPGAFKNGADNIISDSCLSNTVRPGFLFEMTGGGDSVRLQNVTQNQPPSFVNAAAADYRLLPGSNCKGMGLADASRLPYGPVADPGGEDPDPPFVLSAPRTVTAVAGNGRATVSWLPPANLPVGAEMEYRVETLRPGDSRNGAECVVKSALSCTITGLNNLARTASPYTFTVRGSDGAGNQSLVSAPSNGVRPQAPVEFSARISGTQKVGSKLTAVASQLWPAGSALSYQWLRGSSVIRGATRSSYTPTSADVGAVLGVRITGSKADYRSTTITVASAKKVAPIAVKVRKLVYTGTLKVGKKLKAKSSGLSPASAKAKYRWYRGSKAIPGATRSSYTLKKADAGKKIVLRVTVTAKNYLTVTKKYAKSSRVKVRK